jgi:hypothetical protein
MRFCARNNHHFFALLLAALALVPALQARASEREAPVGLRLLPENTRYFEYKGLPMVLFLHKGGLKQVPGINRQSQEAIVQASRHANHFYMPLHSTWVRATAEEVHAQLQDDAHWGRVREIARTAFEHDVILHLFFWSYKFNFEKQDWSGSDMVWPDPADDGGVLVESAGLTRRDLHELAVNRAVEATWDLPNVVYNFMWEYNVRQRKQDPEGAFHRWWAAQVRERGRQLDPAIEHRISVKLGYAHPSSLGADFVVEEDGNGFWLGHSHKVVLAYNVPAVFISSDFVFADNDFNGWEHVPFNPRKWANGQVLGHPITPNDLRAMVSEGFHPAETWVPARDDTLPYYLQMRWYLENAGILDTDAHGAVRTLPRFRPSKRPALSNPATFLHGRNGDQYAAIYAHPEGLPPVLAEVWIDVNGDGRFSPDPADGERFPMKAESDNFKQGVLFTTTGPADRRYLFRFADQNWNPPVRGGLVPGKVEGISYDHWGAR